MIKKMILKLILTFDLQNVLKVIQTPISYVFLSPSYIYVWINWRLIMLNVDGKMLFRKNYKHGQICTILIKLENSEFLAIARLT